MPVETGCFTIGVFQDAEWATRGLAALAAHGFAAESISVLARDGADAATLVQQATGRPPERMDLPRVGPSVGAGPLVAALNGPSCDFARVGVAGAMARVGFQSHDGEIFERLVGRGGLLVAIHSEPRAADALSVLLNYGAGNAAIGAWAGRV